MQTIFCQFLRQYVNNLQRAFRACGREIIRLNYSLIKYVDKVQCSFRWRLELDALLLVKAAQHTPLCRAALTRPALTWHSLRCDVPAKVHRQSVYQRFAPRLKLEHEKFPEIFCSLLP